MSKTAEARKIKRRLTCTCCGMDFTGRQFANQETGYGICTSCAIWLVEEKDYSKAHVERIYGYFGVNHSLEGKRHDQKTDNPLEHIL